MLEFERTVVRLLGANPFYAHILMSVRRGFTKDTKICETAQVSFGNSPVLTVNEDFFLKQTPEHRIGLLEHEILHLIFRHNKRFISKEYTDWGNLMNIACDLVVNQMIKAERLPPDGQIPEIYDLPKNKTAEWYFEELKKSPKLKFIKAGGMNKGGGCCKDDGKGGGDQELRDKITISGIIAGAYAKAKEHPKGIGDLPGDLIQMIEALIAPPKVPWYKELRQFNASLGKASLKTTIKRESKRYGTIPGTKIKGGSYVLVVIDTSGSISDDDLKLFGNEIHHMHRNGAIIDIAMVDTMVHSVEPYRNRILKAKGRGGTDLRVIYDWIKKSNKRYDGLIFLTDGYTPWLEASPLPVKTLFVINKGKKCSDWGKTIHIE